MRRGHLVTLIGEGITVDELAHHFGTIGYEVLTSLGKRYARIYKGGNVVAEPCSASGGAGRRFCLDGHRRVRLQNLENNPMQSRMGPARSAWPLGTGTR